MFQRSEKDVSQETTDWFAAGKIQQVDEIIPTGVRVQRMLVGDEGRCMVTVILIDASQFEGAVAKRCNSGLNGDDSASGRKSAIVE